jgi:hypothetical protein
MPLRNRMSLDNYLINSDMLRVIFITFAECSYRDGR